MLQYLIVILAVGLSLAVTVRMLYRVISGKGSNCSLCDECGAHKQCKDKPKPADCQGPPTTPPCK